ncbi:hypothetical protein TNCV_1741071 [Trichonephila clavipes]|uniref:Uncharacterized protein n=1 Tax=Trichonephila clavipes TaxID=2585209 RepID=A0A8X6RN27_TRICX|nr:hypothetical protein TNCV_1741071 [Trichonephila clavipes]
MSQSEAEPGHPVTDLAILFSRMTTTRTVLARPLSKIPQHANGKILSLSGFNVHQHLNPEGLHWYLVSNPLLDNAGQYFDTVTTRLS